MSPWRSARGLLDELTRLSRQEGVETEGDRLMEILRCRPGDHADRPDGIGSEGKDERFAPEHLGHLSPESIVRDGWIETSPSSEGHPVVLAERPDVGETQFARDDRVVSVFLVGIEHHVVAEQRDLVLDQQP
jgi:hypothetical protein